LLDWTRLPAELNTGVKRKRKRPAKSMPLSKKAAPPLITSRLDVSYTFCCDKGNAFYLVHCQFADPY